jgi:uncharacterized protein YcgI (DUF1989 family)
MTMHDHAISPDGRPEPGRRYQVPARRGRAFRLRAGAVMTVINTHGTQVGDFWAFAESDMSEHLSMPHLHTDLSRLNPRPGDRLVSNRRRPLLELVEDTSPGVHDTVIAACDATRYAQLGVVGHHDSCAENLHLALDAIGLEIGETPAPFNLWMNTPVRADGSVDWLPTVSRAGDVLRLRALVDCVAVLSACPQDVTPINGRDAGPTELHVEVSAP